MLCILSGTQQFFRSPDDMTALAEITALFGSDAMQQIARKLGTFYINGIVKLSFSSLFHTFKNYVLIQFYCLKNF